jgi:glutaconate CoA-transferase subunit B
MAARHGGEKMNGYSPSEMMVARAARELRNGEVVFVGIGLPNIACNLARKLHAPDLVLIYESGAVGAVPSRLPLSIGDPCLAQDSLSICSMVEVFQYYLQGGLIDVGFLGGAQVDRFGNINSTVIGPYERPKVRLPGSGGACEIAVHAGKVIIILPQTAKSFPEKVDFVTSAGFIEGGNGRRARGMPGGGPSLVITDLGVYRFSRPNREMFLKEIHPGVAVEKVRENTGWEMKIARDLATTAPPTAEELRLIREDLDPDRLHLR